MGRLRDENREVGRMGYIRVFGNGVEGGWWMRVIMVG